MGAVELENGTALDFHIFKYKVIFSWDRQTDGLHRVKLYASNYMYQMIWCSDGVVWPSNCRLLIWKDLISDIWNHSRVLNQNQSGLQGSSACTGDCLNYCICTVRVTGMIAC